MILAKLRNKYVILITFLVLVIVGIWFYKTLYGSTSSALQRAENFLFTRMTVTQLGDQGSMRYFYVTNRQMTGDNEVLENRFGSEREPKLKFGFYDTKVEPSVGLGMFINPSEWFQTEEIRIKKMQALQQETFVEQVRKLVHNSPQRSLLIVVHGFRERFPSAFGPA